MRLLFLSLLIIVDANATCLQDGELELVTSLSPDEAQEFMINKADLLNDKKCADTAEGIDFSALKESIDSINKGSK